MRCVIRVRRGNDPAQRAVIVLETGWFTDTWHTSTADWTIRIGSNGRGHWAYYPTETLYGQTISEASISLFQGIAWNVRMVGYLTVSRYPPQAGDSGAARILIASVPGILETYDTEWERIR
ncbi:MAG TPA: hypothetical protein PK036_17480 [Geobacteraceae bacterium]|nr:hypothetical protein [Geobacteraceae bacterium]